MVELLGLTTFEFALLLSAVYLFAGTVKGGSWIWLATGIHFAVLFGIAS